MSAPKKQNFNVESLLEQLADADLRTAAFYVITGIGGGVYAPDFIYAAILFSTLPCPETAAVLVASNQSLRELVQRSPESLMEEMIHDEHDFEREQFNAWMKSFAVNRRACDGIYQFLEQGLKQSQITQHFDEPGYNHRLNDRLSLFGLQKGMFQRRTNFLQDQFLDNRRLFNATLDLCCIRYSNGNTPEYWTPIGEQTELKKYEASEIQYELGGTGEEFRKLVSTLRADDGLDVETHDS
ncbi:hypothetical protein V6x_07310 [Gimesia chilikensis]|uniref:Uncharacterized protein n=1 Tax=Gimesia chilikensis TaxID=2605989 RepID=A0A517W743_9PLAN|nr:hypothetical protein [Gimesia chilikensis]QDU01053.1 hypothetical protein V6x_07310 [Gimesia chilikensis]